MSIDLMETKTKQLGLVSTLYNSIQIFNIIISQYLGTGIMFHGTVLDNTYIHLFIQFTENVWLPTCVQKHV